MQHLRRSKLLPIAVVLITSFCLGESSLQSQTVVPPGFQTAEQGPPANLTPNNRRNPQTKPRGGLRIGGAPAGDIRKAVEKQNNVDRPNLKQVRDTQYYRIAIARPDNSLLGMNYYPALPGDNPPVILLVHEKDRSSRDFSDKIEEFKDPNGLAAALQNDGFAVITLDIAGLTDPRNRNASLTKDDPAKSARTTANQSAAKIVEQAVTDLRLTYQFLIDRHNRLEFNLAKLSILSLGEGSNVVLEWIREATGPAPVLPGIRINPADPRLKNAGAQIASGERDSATGRPSDISALIMLSPVDHWQNVRTSTVLKAYLDGSPVPTLVLGGTNDKDSAETLKLIKPIVERRESRLSKVEELTTSLHGARLLRFEPGLVTKINRFLEQTVEFQKSEWEPRYNLTPVSYKLVEAVSKTAAQAASRAANANDKPAPEKTEPKPKNDEIPKADEKPKTQAKQSDVPQPVAKTSESTKTSEVPKPE